MWCRVPRFDCNPRRSTRWPNRLCSTVPRGLISSYVCILWCSADQIRSVVCSFLVRAVQDADNRQQFVRGDRQWNCLGYHSERGSCNITVCVTFLNKNDIHTASSRSSNLLSFRHAWSRFPFNQPRIWFLAVSNHFSFSISTSQKNCKNMLVEWVRCVPYNRFRLAKHFEKLEAKRRKRELVLHILMRSPVDESSEGNLFFFLHHLQYAT